jgi:hypothetical protein
MYLEAWHVLTAAVLRGLGLHGLASNLGQGPQPTFRSDGAAAGHGAALTAARTSLRSELQVAQTDQFVDHALHQRLTHVQLSDHIFEGMCAAGAEHL